MARVKFQFEFIVNDKLTLDEALEQIQESIIEDGISCVINESNVVSFKKGN